MTTSSSTYTARIDRITDLLWSSTLTVDGDVEVGDAPGRFMIVGKNNGDWSFAAIMESAGACAQEVCDCEGCDDYEVFDLDAPEGEDSLDMIVLKKVEIRFAGDVYKAEE